MQMQDLLYNSNLHYINIQIYIYYTKDYLNS